MRSELSVSVAVLAQVMGEPLSKKLTEPVGDPAPGELTLTDAVKVTLWPTTEGLADEGVNDVVVAPCPTGSESELEVVEVAKLMSPR